VLDIIGEISSTPSCVYRGWAYLFSKKYRTELNREYEKIGLISTLLDITLSASFFIAEIVGIAYLLYWFAANAN
jgi:hypothetical protein